MTVPGPTNVRCARGTASLNFPRHPPLPRWPTALVVVRWKLSSTGNGKELKVGSGKVGLGGMRWGQVWRGLVRQGDP